MNTLEQALRYADNGWAVFPIHGIHKSNCTCGMKCASPGKHPLTKNGLKDATTDPEQITEWFTRWPNANIAIATGKQSDLWVVDVDNKRTVEIGNRAVGVGDNSIREMENENEPLPEGRYVETGGGGRHIYFSFGEGCSGNRANIRDGIDVRGDGGYVVAPPSVHISGHTYRWQNDDLLPSPAPKWLVGLARISKTDSVSEEDVVGEGGRNHFLHQLGAKYRRENGYEEWKLYGLLQAHNHRQCNPPLSADEVQRIAHNCAQYDYTPVTDLSQWAKAGEPEPIPEGGDLAVSLFDLVNNPPDPPVPLVNGVISVGTGVLIAGQPNVGKSWMVMDMALAVASGEAWLDSYPSTQGPVLMIDEEGTEYGQYQRFKMLLDGRNYMSAAGLPLNVAIGSGIRLDTDIGITRVRRMLERYNPRLVVIDSLVRMHSGEENNSGHMSKFFDITKGLMRTYDATFLFTHHVRKPSLDSADPGDLIRGTTEIRAWPDTIFVITPGEDSQEVIFHHVKSRYSQRSEPFKVRYQIDGDAGTAKFVHAGEVEPNDRSLATQHNRVLRAIIDITDSGRNADLQSIADAVERTPRTIREYLAQLVRSNTVEVLEMSVSGSRPVHVYRIKGT